MRSLYAILVLLFWGEVCIGQDFKAEFNKYCQSEDTVKLQEVLLRWEKEAPKDAELFTSYLNYYFLKSRKEVLSVTTDVPDGEHLAIQDSSGNTAGFFGSQVIYLDEPFEKGMDKIDEGIKLYPNRLDMRFGKIYILGLKQDWDRFTAEIVKTIVYSSQNKNKWTWTNNEKHEGGAEFFLISLQDYQLTLYNAGNDKLLMNMRTIANEILKYYPNHIPSLSNLSITYLLNNDYDKAIEILLKAEKINPKDGVVLSNIAHAYKQKGDVESAIKYYNKMVENNDDPEGQEFAKEQIEALRK